MFYRQKWYFSSHVSHASDYEQKARAYRQKTAPYIELDSDPLWTVFDKLVHLLNSLRSKDHIRARQLDEMMPKKRQNSFGLFIFYSETP